MHNYSSNMIVFMIIFLFVCIFLRMRCGGQSACKSDNAHDNVYSQKLYSQKQSKPNYETCPETCIPAIIYRNN